MSLSCIADVFKLRCRNVQSRNIFHQKIDLNTYSNFLKVANKKMPQPYSTKNRVKILPESLINKIAAGEVVERPASVVKELLENAIDAGATDVQVSIKNGGKDLISILDNGCGMSEADAQLAVERHATSKIIDEDDLFRIQTLGFRGEALAAIASVSHFELLTCDDESQGATRIFIKGGYLEQVGKIGFPKGTKITVERLFYNTPARLKFLKTTATSAHSAAFGTKVLGSSSHSFSSDTQ